MPHVDKVAAYITYGEQLLVFEQPDFPEAGVQVPGGTMEPAEDAMRAVLREAREETGLQALEVVRFLGTQLHSASPGVTHRRRYFHLTVKERPPSAWDHQETSANGGGPPILFRFRWVPLDSVPPLAGERGALLAQLASGMARPRYDDSSRSPRIRHAARVLVFDPKDRLLLLNGLAVDGSAYWLAPGGGLQSGEDYACAALREVHEELGISVELGPLVWSRRHVFATSHGMLDQTERFFVARTRATVIVPVEPDRYVTGHRWWTLEELRASRETFTPRKLPELLPALLNGEWPNAPIDVAAV